MEVVAINMLPEHATDQKWQAFWWSVGGGDAHFAEDTNKKAITAFNVTALGTTIIINREGQIVYRDAGASTYEKLRSEVDNAL